MTAPNAAKAYPDKSSARFEVRGIDATTQQPVKLFSRAPTEELARKFARTMGLRAETIEVVPVCETE